MNLRELFAKKAPAEDYEAVRAELNDQLGAARKATRELAKRRLELLAAGAPDSELDALDAQLADQGKSVQRLEERIATVNNELAAAEKRDAAAELDARVNAAQEAQAEALTWIEGPYVQHAQALAEGLARLSEIHAEIKRVNLELVAAGLGARKIEIPERTYARPPHFFFASLPERTVLPEPSNRNWGYWPPRPGEAVAKAKTEPEATATSKAPAAASAEPASITAAE